MPIPLRWMELNTKGFTQENPRIVRVRDLLRDHKGNWVKGYSRRLAHTTSLTAELWG